MEVLIMLKDIRFAKAHHYFVTHLTTEHAKKTQTLMKIYFRASLQPLLLKVRIDA